MLTRKLSTAIVTFSTVIALSVTPALADTQVGQIGNGAFSNNQATVTTTNTNSAVQTNSADISNNVTSKSDTGGNSADFTTGGNASIETGGATSNTQIANLANSNLLSVTPGCNCQNGAQLLQTGNGSFSDNGISVSSANDNQLFQTNSADVNNNVHSSAKTGGNSADYTTNGNATITTGAAKDTVGVLNTLNQNVATSGFAAGAGVDGSLFGTSAIQNGNGAFATDNITVAKTNSNEAVQNNTAYVMNDVKSSASSGKNSADYTTGGSVTIGTGPSENDTLLKTLANSNVLAGFDNGMGCGCDLTFVKQADNGAESSNGVTASVANANSLFQTNDSSVSNHVDTYQKSGHNSASYSTGSVFGFADPSIMTGPSNSTTGVETAVNQNTADSNGVTVGGWNFVFNWNPFSL